MEIVSKSANQVWKELKRNGQTSLGFKEWLDREKQKEFKNFEGESTVPTNTFLNANIQSVISNMNDEELGTKNKYILGANKNVLIGIGVGVLVITGVILYIKFKRK